MRDRGNSPRKATSALGTRDLSRDSSRLYSLCASSLSHLAPRLGDGTGRSRRGVAQRGLGDRSILPCSIPVQRHGERRRKELARAVAEAAGLGLRAFPVVPREVPILRLRLV